MFFLAALSTSMLFRSAGTKKPLATHAANDFNSEMISNTKNRESLLDKSMQGEIWKPIPNFDGVYEVSNTGRVRSLDRFVSGCPGHSRFSKGRILKYQSVSRDYIKVTLCDGITKKGYRIHRLVAESFLNDFDPDLQVDHIDGNPKNNHVANLRMATLKQNHRAFRRIAKTSSSKYRGVSWHQKSKIWRAAIQYDGIRIHIGSFKNEMEAALAYNARAIKMGFMPEALNKINL